MVLVQVIYCSKGGGVIFLKEPAASLRGDPELQAYIHSRKPDLPVSHSSPFSSWLSNHNITAGLWVLLVAVVPLPSQLDYPHHLLCIFSLGGIVNIK